MILLLDNFDSFTYNLVDYFGRLGMECHVVRNDVPLSVIQANSYKGVVLSPGPESPEKAGNLLEVLAYYHDKLPILGICLGHQAIGLYFGAELVKNRPMHGKISQVNCDVDNPIFLDFPKSFTVVRYHSLILQNLKNELRVTAKTGSGEIMAIAHEKYPIWGLQYHPEAILTEYGIDVLKNWIMLLEA